MKWSDYIRSIRLSPNRPCCQMCGRVVDLKTATITDGEETVETVLCGMCLAHLMGR